MYRCLSVLSVCLSACLSICLSFCLSFCLFVCLSVCLSACLSVCLSACLSVCLSVCLSTCRSGWLAVCLSAYLLACLSVCLSFGPGINSSAYCNVTNYCFYVLLFCSRLLCSQIKQLRACQLYKFCCKSERRTKKCPIMLYTVVNYALTATHH